MREHVILSRVDANYPFQDKSGVQILFETIVHKIGWYRGQLHDGIARGDSVAGQEWIQTPRYFLCDGRGELRLYHDCHQILVN